MYKPTCILEMIGASVWKFPVYSDSIYEYDHIILVLRVYNLGWITIRYTQ